MLLFFQMSQHEVTALYLCVKLMLVPLHDESGGLCSCQCSDLIMRDAPLLGNGHASSHLHLRLCLCGLCPQQ